MVIDSACQTRGSRGGGAKRALGVAAIARYGLAFAAHVRQQRSKAATTRLSVRLPSARRASAPEVFPIGTRPRRRSVKTHIASLAARAFVAAFLTLAGAVESSASVLTTYSASRSVYCLGDSNWAYPGSPQGWWLNAVSSTGWVRDAAGQNSTLTPQRIYYDDTVSVMQSVSGRYGHAAISGPCRTAAVRIDRSDPAVPGIFAGAQGSVLRPYHDLYTNPFWGPPPTAIPQQGKTWWYGFAAKTNPGYVPHGWNTPDLAFGNWNSFGLEWHVSIGGTTLGPIMQEIATIGPASGGTSGPNGSVVYTCNQTMTKLRHPRLQIALTAGLNTATTDDATHTCRRILGPAFQAGRLYKSIYQVKWDAFRQGEFRWWVDSGDGRGYVQYADLTGVSTLWRSGSSPDTGTYPQLLNYRKADTSLPTSIMYYGGFVRGSTMTDVAIPSR